jgi:ribonucleoside-diphosphate reductase alpha chain
MINKKEIYEKFINFKDDWFQRFIFSKEVWEDNYKFKQEKDYNDTARRLAIANSSVEKEKNKKEWEDKFFFAISKLLLCPGGRIIANLGTGEDRKHTTLFNCYIWSVQEAKMKNCDSIEGIYDALKIQAHTLKSEGGYGVNASWIRPSGTYVQGIGGRTPGVLKFMELWDKSSEIITMGSDKTIGEKKDEEKINASG